jgi:hypothetical protein
VRNVLPMTAYNPAPALGDRLVRVPLLKVRLGRQRRDLDLPSRLSDQTSHANVDSKKKRLAKRKVYPCTLLRLFL